MKHEKVYLAGPLFTKYEIEARKQEHKLFKEAFPHIQTFAPIDAPFNGGNPMNIEIYETDKAEMDSSTIFIFDLNNNDPGTLVEVGIAAEKHKNDPTIEVYGFLWDLRMNRKPEANSNQWARPWGVNAFLVGAIEKHGKMFETFEDVIAYMKEKRK